MELDIYEKSKPLFFSEPSSIILNLDTYPLGNGFKDIKITINNEEFIITKEDIHEILKIIKKEN